MRAPGAFAPQEETMRLKPTKPIVPPGRQKRPAQDIPTAAGRLEAQQARRPRKPEAGPPGAQDRPKP